MSCGSNVNLIVNAFSVFFCPVPLVDYPEASLKPGWYIIPKFSSQIFFYIDSDQFHAWDIQRSAQGFKHRF